MEDEETFVGSWKDLVPFGKILQLSKFLLLASGAWAWAWLAVQPSVTGAGWLLLLAGLLWSLSGCFGGWKWHVSGRG